MKKEWTQAGSDFYVCSVSLQIPVLPNGIFVVKHNPNIGLYLEKVSEKFEFPYKVYSMESDFIKYVSKTYKNTKSNMGILLNGIKGTGKTVTAEQVCNALELPIILINQDFSEFGLINFMANIQQEVVFFLDEFEKVFVEKQGGQKTLLTIMDGALKNKYRKVFLLTTNETRVDDNLLQRPSRIRYLKHFGNLSTELIIEIVDDKLKKKAHREELIKYIAQLEIITVDIVSAVIEETNIHDVPPSVYEGFFNVNKLNMKMDVFKYVPDLENGIEVERIFKSSTAIAPAQPDAKSIGEMFSVGGSEIGEIVEVKDEQEEGQVVRVKNFLYDTTKGEDQEPVEQVQTFRCVRAYTFNSAFSGYYH